MALWQKRAVIVIAFALAGILLGRLSVRALINWMVGGSLFGGNFL